MSRSYLRSAIEYRGREIDLIRYHDGGREYGVVFDRPTVEAEGYLAIYPSRKLAERHIDSLIDNRAPLPEFEAFLCMIGVQ